MNANLLNTTHTVGSTINVEVLDIDYTKRIVDLKECIQLTKEMTKE
jgi:hypothetical protein